MGSAVWRRAVEAAEAGASSPRVMRMLRRGYSTPCSVVSHTSRVRSELARRSPRVDASSLRPTRAEVASCRRRQRAALEQKSATVQRVDGMALWREATRAIADSNAGLYDLTLALLLLTGRRQTELLNGRTVFRSGALGANGARFTGQLKRRTSAEPYDIPLLCPRRNVVRALRRLRALQPDDVATWPHRRVSARYQSGLGRHMARSAVYGALRRPHDLRGAYATLVHAWWDCGDASPALVAMRVLGEGRLEDALPYTTYRLEPRAIAPRTFGTLAL